jgi:glycosyltransferase involved in cell wall biosynthesis
MQKAKVLYVIGTLDVGGAEKQLVELATRLDRRRFHPMICAFTGGPLLEPLTALDVPVHVLDGLPASQRRSRSNFPAWCRMLWRLLGVIRREQPVILHGVLLWAYVFGTYTGRLTGVPYVVAGRRSLGLFKEGKPHYLAMERVADWMTDLFIANSEAVRQDTIRREKIAPGKILVIPNGVDLGRYEAVADEALAAELKLPPGPRVIVVSNLRPYKGYEYFLRAWRDVVERFPSAVAMLVGDGVLRTQLEAQAEELGISQSVRFLGLRHDVPALLAHADVYVHPSLQEGFSNSILEAMAAGKAIVATSVGGNVEAIADGATGLLVPAGDSDRLRAAMIRLLADPEGARRLGAAARAHVREHYEIDAMVRRYEQVYTGLLEGRTPPGRGAA